ncbi:MAG: hypothetical protein Q9169_007619 [Polycauliona sp. 2 TL-2023]
MDKERAHRTLTTQAAEGGAHKTNSAPHQKSSKRLREYEYKKVLLSSTLFQRIAVASHAQSSLIGRPIFSASLASSSAPTIMDDFAARSVYEPIDWNRSVLAKHDEAFRQGTLIGSRRPKREVLQSALHAAEPLLHDLFGGIVEEASPNISCDHETAPISINTTLMKADHPPETIFEHWLNGKRPTTTIGSTKFAPHKCGVKDCEKSFVRKGDLVRHLKSHNSGPRTHSCLADSCRRKGIKGFWRLDKLKDHMERKHPEIEIERWTATDAWYLEMRVEMRGYRDVEKREEHEAAMLSKGYKPDCPGSKWFNKMSASEMAAA